LEPSIGLLPELIGKRIETNLLIEENSFVDPQIMTIYRREGVESLQEYLVECLKKEWMGRLPVYEELPQPLPRNISHLYSSLGIATKKKKPKPNTSTESVKRNTSGTSTTQQTTSGLKNSGNKNITNTPKPSTSPSIAAPSEPDERVVALARLGVSSIQKLISSLKEFSAPVGEVKATNEIVPLMNKFKSIKQAADDLRVFVPSDESPPPNADSVLERAKKLILNGLQDIEYLLRETMVYLGDSTNKDEIIKICSILKKIQSALDV